MEHSYLSQIRRIRSLAEEALQRFPLRSPQLHFIQHGENTTFRVEAGSRRFLLRVHRAGYHSASAILEELSWLRRLATVEELITPAPLLSRSGKWLETVATDAFPEGRLCDMLEWVHGSFLRKRYPENRIFQLGSLMAVLQKHSMKSKHRIYWDAEGLVGRNGKFGTIDSLAGVSPRNQEIITEARKIVLAKLSAFEKRFPERQSLIHADLHFGNFLVSDGRLGAIDFDDSGFGFHAYDLAIPLTQLENIFGKEPKKYSRYVELIQEGYAARGSWDAYDRTILPTMVTARRLLMLGWLHSRSDLPAYRKILPGAVSRALKHLKRNKTLSG